eukprot:scaffold110432_cov18-Tisochrysis_lutea.AAC.1
MGCKCGTRGRYEFHVRTSAYAMLSSFASAFQRAVLQAAPHADASSSLRERVTAFPRRSSNFPVPRITSWDKLQQFCSYCSIPTADQRGSNGFCSIMQQAGPIGRYGAASCCCYCCCPFVLKLPQFM